MTTKKKSEKILKVSIFHRIEYPKHPNGYVDIIIMSTRTATQKLKKGAKILNQLDKGILKRLRNEEKKQ